MKSFLALALSFALIILGQTNAHAEDTEKPAPAPAAEPSPPSEKKPAGGLQDPVNRIKQIDADNFSLDEIRFNRVTREIRFPAKVNMTRDQIEYIIVTEKGKTHESLLSTKTSPFVLNVVSLLCRYRPSAEGLIEFVEREGPDGGGGPATPAPVPPSDPAPPPIDPFVKEEDAGGKGSPTKPPTAPAPIPVEKKPIDNLVQIFVSYKKDGKEVEILLDDWILNTLTKTSLGDVFWVYTGSDIVEGGDFGAELEGSIVAIYVDRFAMFNNPIKGNTNDEIWEPFTKRMPEVDTPVEVIIRPFKPAAKKEK